MARKLYEEQNIENIANAIRNKLEIDDTFKVSEMSEAINNIPTRGGEGATNSLDLMKILLGKAGFVFSEFNVFSPTSGNYITVPHNLGQTPTEVIAFCETLTDGAGGYVLGYTYDSQFGNDNTKNRTYLYNTNNRPSTPTEDVLTSVLSNYDNYFRVPFAPTAWNFCQSVDSQNVQIRNQDGNPNAKMLGLKWYLGVR